MSASEVMETSEAMSATGTAVQPDGWLVERPAQVESPADDAAPSRPSRFGGATAVWVGAITTAVGFAVIAFSWGRIAGIVEVGRQMPYVVAGGCTGLGLVLCGLTIVHLGVSHEAARNRRAHLEALEALLAQINAAVDDQGTR